MIKIRRKHYIILFFKRRKIERDIYFLFFFLSTGERLCKRKDEVGDEVLKKQTKK